MTAKALNQTIIEVNATDSETADRHRFPGSPTIRINGQDIEPGFKDPGDYSPRCRLYTTQAGVGSLPERRWIEDAIEYNR